MGGSFIEHVISAGGPVGDGQVKGVELGPELPLVLSVDIGLLVGHDAGDRLGREVYFCNRAFRWFRVKPCSPAIRVTDSKNPASGGLSPEK